LIAESLEFFLYTLISIFVIVAPISGVVTFISMTSEMIGEEKTKSQKKQFHWLA
jgi:multiple antibiotic resistance protein